MKAAAKAALKDILGYNTAPLVRRLQSQPGVEHLRRDADQGLRTRLVKVLSWYDNEWGFSNRMLDATVALMAAR